MEPDDVSFEVIRKATARVPGPVMAVEWLPYRRGAWRAVCEEAVSGY
jgi:hypothetical protein